MGPNRQVFRSAAAILLIGSIVACSTLGPDYEKPSVTLSSFKPLPSEGMIPAFEIGLRIINPNRQALNLEGIVYTVSLQGHEIVKGVGKDFAPIEGYSEGTVTLTAAPNVLAGIRLISGMMNDPVHSMDYEFEAKLDMGGLYPAVRIREKGNFQMGEQRTAPQ
jgi:hypothetical protein